MSPADTAQALESRTLDAPRLHRFIATVTHADTGGGATTWDLTTLTLAALYYHPDLELSRAKFATTEAAVVTAKQYPNPIVDFTAIKHTVVVDSYSWTVGLLVNFVLETFGKRDARIAVAQSLADAARQDLATAAWQVRGRVRTALLALWTARARFDLLERRRDLQQQLVTLLDRRLAEGVASALDLTRERIVLSGVSLDAQDAQRQAEEARVQLATAVGVPASALDAITLSLDAFDQPALAGADEAAYRRQALLGRTDVRALVEEYEAAQAALRLELARQYPNIALGPGYTFDQGDHQYSLQIAAQVPLFNQNQGPIAEAEARRREAGTRLLALQAGIIGQIDRALALYRAATRSVATAENLRIDAERRRDQIERAFGLGETDRPALVTSRLELAATELLRVDALVPQRQALGLLEDALQRPLFDPGASLFMPTPASDQSLPPEPAP